MLAPCLTMVNGSFTSFVLSLTFDTQYALQCTLKNRESYRESIKSINQSKKRYVHRE